MNNVEIFFGLKAKTYSYLIDDDRKDIKAKGTQKHIRKGNFKFKDSKSSLDKPQYENKLN